MPERLTFADIKTQKNKLSVVCIVYTSSLNDRRERLDSIMGYLETLFQCEDYDADMLTRWFYEISVHGNIRKEVQEEYANESDAIHRLHELFTIAASQYSFLTTKDLRHALRLFFTNKIPFLDYIEDSGFCQEMLWEEPN